MTGYSHPKRTISQLQPRTHQVNNTVDVETLFIQNGLAERFTRCKLQELDRAKCENLRRLKPPTWTPDQTPHRPGDSITIASLYQSLENHKEVIKRPDYMPNTHIVQPQNEQFPHLPDIKNPLLQYVYQDTDSSYNAQELGSPQLAESASQRRYKPVPDHANIPPIGTTEHELWRLKVHMLRHKVNMETLDRRHTAKNRELLTDDLLTNQVHNRQNKLHQQSRGDTSRLPAPPPRSLPKLVKGRPAQSKAAWQTDPSTRTLTGDHISVSKCPSMKYISIIDSYDINDMVTWSRDEMSQSDITQLLQRRSSVRKYPPMKQDISPVDSYVTDYEMDMSLDEMPQPELPQQPKKQTITVRLPSMEDSITESGYWSAEEIKHTDNSRQSAAQRKVHVPVAPRAPKTASSNYRAKARRVKMS